MPVNEAHRPYLESMRMLAQDTQGREVLVGLTHSETEWYFAYLENEYRTDPPSPSKTIDEMSAEQDRYIELHRRHELARLQILTAERESRQNLIRH